MIGARRDLNASASGAGRTRSRRAASGGSAVVLASALSALGGQGKSHHSLQDKALTVSGGFIFEWCRFEHTQRSRVT